MDLRVFPPPLGHQPPPPSPPSSDASFPILAISILGILTTSILLLSYYVFAVRCCLNWRRSDVVGRLSRSRRRLDDRLMAYSTVTESHGLGESEIRAIPTLRYRSGGDGAGKTSFHECAVCLNEFQEEERIRLLPNCFHVFHIDCIDTWLQTNANCPLCRSSITTAAAPVPLDQFTASAPHQDPRRSGDIVIDIRDDDSDPQAQAVTATDANTNPSRWKSEQRVGHKRGRKVHRHGSMGDECIDTRAKDGQLQVQPIRRSFSMDSSSDRQLYMAVQKIMRQNPHFLEATGGESSSTSGRIRRSLFSFHRHSRSAVLPVQIEQ
ncbi:RING-H2 finger protein ATL1-like [Musa acuminata AAA Group]|uniref:RING-H2 finger protein ATL1-like n=1 Tax=Musa acuminata AAA Group TaxID=214697 RepID=UPI0031D64595